MKKIIVFIGILSFLGSCRNANQKASGNIALIEKYVESVENLDHDLMDSFLAEDYMGYGPSANDSIDKSGAVESWKNNVEELYEKIDYRSSRSVAMSIPDGENKGHWVSNWSQLEITYKEDGEKVTIWANTVYKIEGDKISKSYTFYNEADVLEQLGYVFVNPDNL